MAKAGTGDAVKRERVPQAERRRITRGKLLDATIESLIDRGYARTTTVEVGERTGLSRGTQLHYFPSKADLLVSAIEHLADGAGCAGGSWNHRDRSSACATQIGVR